MLFKARIPQRYKKIQGYKIVSSCMDGWVDNLLFLILTRQQIISYFEHNFTKINTYRRKAKAFNVAVP